MYIIHSLFRWCSTDSIATAHVCAGIPGIPPCDGGLPCITAFCPVDISGKKTTVANEFCEVDALEDTKCVFAFIVPFRFCRGGY